MSGYAKLYSAVTESSLWSEPLEVRILFISMLAKADASGFVEAALPGLARLANISLEATKEAIRVLESPDPNSKDLDRHPENEGRRLLKVPGGWLIINYQEYRSQRDDEERRRWMREYMANYRAKGRDKSRPVNPGKLPVNTGKPGLAQAEAEAEAVTHRAEPDGPCTLDDCINHARFIALPDIEAEKFWNYYAATGWQIGGTPVRNWKPLMQKWKINHEQQRHQDRQRAAARRPDRSAGTYNEGVHDQYDLSKRRPKKSV